MWERYVGGSKSLRGLFDSCYNALLIGREFDLCPVINETNYGIELELDLR